MKQKKVKILVACHKPDAVYEDEVYTPIHVGKVISKCKSEMSYMIGDDTGDNISEKNPFYCELTAQYWAWKNLDVEYIGLCHYRRYFASKITILNIEKILKDCDVVLTKPIVEKMSIGVRLQCATCLEDFTIFYKCINNLYPQYSQTLYKILNSNSFSPYNMFLMHKTEFNRFAEWQFSILFEMEKYVRLSGYSRARRLYGYLSEILLTVYIKHNGLKVKYDDVVPMIGDKPKKMRFIGIKNCLKTLLFKMFRTSIDYTIHPAVLIGFKNDGINLN